MNVRIRFAVSLLPLLIVSLPAQTQQPVFPVTPSFTPPSLVLTSASGDFDGDGVADFIYTDATSDVVVLLNRGANSPPVVVTSPALSCTVNNLVTADMNKDGKLDAIASCREGYVAVLLGNGDGTFQTPVYYSVNTTNQILQIQPPVDMNGDGYPDIVATIGLSQGDAVAVWLNKGSTSPGVLSNPQTYPYPNNGAGPIAGVGDFNGDGKQDVAFFTATLVTSPSVFFGNGDGTLQAAQAQPQTCGTGSAVEGAAAGDFNNDGISDLAIECGATVSGGPQSLQMWLGSTGGQLTAGPVTSIPAAQAGSPIPIGTNGDKNLDLALQGNSLSILLGDGKGGFSLGQSYAVSGAITPEPPDANGKVNLVLYAGDALFTFNSNGDGTFQAPLLFSPASVTADFNGDGIADTLGVNGSDLVVALGRGNGTFTVTNQQALASLPVNETGTPVAADFDGDGKVDAVLIQPGVGAGHGETTVFNAQLYFYKGNGDGTLQAAGSPISIPIYGAMDVVAGDFNGDGKMDILIAYSNQSASTPTGYGLMLLTGNGDGTFSVPSSPFFQTAGFSLIVPPLLVGDLNGDHRPDLIWNNAVFLNNGDGTFQRSPLTLSGTPHALADLNGDGKLDLIEGLAQQDPVTQSYSYPEAVFAGNGDGTFQSSPFYSATLPQYAQGIAAAVGDVNNDGHPDLVLQYQTAAATSPITVFFGDGTGNFTQDSNTYYPGFFNSSSSSTALSLVRLNNQAPALASDKALDLLAFTSSGVTPLLNQNNPAPAAPIQIPSHVSLSVSPANANQGQAITYTATVTGATPTGTVTFTSGTTTLGTGTVNSGSATLSASFAAAGTYSVTANYSGDANNQASTSSAQSVTVIAPDYSLTANPTTATIKAGQTATFAITMASVGGYSGTVKFSCGTLPAEVTCTFSPATLTGSSNSTSSTLTITTTAPQAMLQYPGSSSAQVAMWAMLLGLCFSPRRARRARKHLARTMALLLIATGSLIWITGCSSSPSTPKDPGTPIGMQSITVSAADSGSGLSHNLNLQLTVQ